MLVFVLLFFLKMDYRLIFDYYFTYYNPIIWTFGIIINLFASRTWFIIKKKEKSPLYTYLLASSCLYTFSCTANTLLSFKFCGSLCLTSSTLWAQYIQYIVQNCTIQFVFNFQMFNLLCSTFTTYATLNKKLKRFTKLNPFVGLIISSSFGLIAALTQALYFEIKSSVYNDTLNMTRTVYSVEESVLGKNKDYVQFILYLKGFNYIFPFIVLVILNILMLFQLKKIMEEKKRILTISTNEIEKKSKELKRNHLTMMLFVSLIFGIARVYDLFVVYSDLHFNNYYPLFLTIGFFISSTTVVCHSLVYFRVNVIFKNEAILFLKKIVTKINCRN